MDLDQIILLIKDLPLKEVLAILASQGIYDFSKNGYETLRSLIYKKVSLTKFCFVPNKEEGNILLKFKDKNCYKSFCRLLPDHKYSDLIRVGYLMSQYNKIGGAENRKRFEQIKGEIYGRPNGVILLRIAYLVTTGAIVPVLDYLSELQKKNFDTHYLESAFDETINDWTKYSIFVEKEKPEQEIISDVKNKMLTRQKLILIFAYGSAEIITVRALAQILKEDISKNYFYVSSNNIEGDKPVHHSSFILIE